jgi:hypothetical protein
MGTHPQRLLAVGVGVLLVIAGVALVQHDPQETRLAVSDPKVGASAGRATGP